MESSIALIESDRFGCLRGIWNSNSQRAFPCPDRAETPLRAAGLATALGGCVRSSHQHRPVERRRTLEDLQQLTEAEAPFRIQESDLAIRPLASQARENQGTSWCASSLMRCGMRCSSGNLMPDLDMRREPSWRSSRAFMPPTSCCHRPTRRRESYASVRFSLMGAARRAGQHGSGQGESVGEVRARKKALRDFPQGLGGT